VRQSFSKASCTEGESVPFAATTTLQWVVLKTPHCLLDDSDSESERGTRARLQSARRMRKKRIFLPEAAGLHEFRCLTSLSPNSGVGMGGTGDPPVPSGHWPDGTGGRLALETDARKVQALPIPSGGSPLGTAGSAVLPNGVGIATSKFGLKSESKVAAVHRFARNGL
jgi:hypothetical protein